MSKRILVIDDDPSVRKAFDLALRGQGYELVLADGGEAGVAAAAERTPDLVYLDLRMPGMDGVATLRALRADGFSGPVYIATAFHKEFFDDLVTVRDERIPFELLQKPLERDQIIHITRGILEGEIAVETMPS
jgi:CheY-like chemotaxis protein